MKKNQDIETDATKANNLVLTLSGCFGGKLNLQFLIGTFPVVFVLFLVAMELTFPFEFAPGYLVAVVWAVGV